MQTETRYYIVYQTINLINGKIYIGKHETNNLNDGYLGSGNLIKRAIEKYGKENFKREILFECSSREEMNAKEAELVNEEFLKRDDIYNLKQGGEGGFDYIIKHELHKNPQNHINGGQAYAYKVKHDEQFRKRISDGLKKSWREHPERYVNCGSHQNSKHSFKGKHHTQETKDRIRELAILRGNKNNAQLNTVWVSNEELRVSFSIPKEMLFDYLGMGYIKKRIENWDTYFARKILEENHISTKHLSDEEMILFKQNNGAEIVRLRQARKMQKLQKRINQVQEIANYYMEYGFDKTQQKYQSISPGLTSLEGMLGMFSHYKQHYGIHFTARNNTPGVINGSYFKKDV